MTRSSTAGGRLSDAELAARIAEGAGRLLLGVRHGDLLTHRRLGDAGDALANAWIHAVLRTHRPSDSIVSEESPDDLTRLTASRVWIIDPLDGTSHYSSGSHEWAVHVALTVDGQPTDCAVALPDTDELFRTDTVEPSSGPLTGLIATPHFVNYEISWAANRLNLQYLPIGSAGAKAMAVVRGDADAYVHTGGQYEWDSCAPVGVALAAGLHCSRTDGTPLEYNRRSIYLPDFVICRQEIADDLLAALY